MDFNHKNFFLIKKELGSNSNVIVPCELPPLVPINTQYLQETYKSSDSELLKMQSQIKEQINSMQQVLLDKINDLENTVTKQNVTFAKKIHKIHKQTERNSKILEKIIAHFGFPEPEMEIEITDENLDVCRLPMNTEEELMLCEERLQNTNFNNKMKNHLQKMIGSNLKNLNKVLPRIISDEVMRDYNYNGTHGKKSFGKLKLCDVMREAWSESFFKVEGILRQAIHVANSRYLKRNKTQAIQ